MEHTHSVRLEVTRQSDLAIRALVTLGAVEDGDGPVSARNFAEHLDTSAGFMSQVMNPMVKAGWVTSVAGRTGGYRLAVPLSSLSVLDVIELVDGPVDDRCIVVGVPCESHDHCPMHTAWSAARRILIDTLADHRLDQVNLGY